MSNPWANYSHQFIQFLTHPTHHAVLAWNSLLFLPIYCFADSCVSLRVNRRIKVHSDLPLPHSHSFAHDKVILYVMCAHIVTSASWEATPLLLPYFPVFYTSLESSMYLLVVFVGCFNFPPHPVHTHYGQFVYAFLQSSF